MIPGEMKVAAGDIELNKGRGAISMEVVNTGGAPFTFEAALSGIGKGSEVHEHVWYRRSFDVPASWRERRVHLNFDACDWETTVWVNGREVGGHRGGYSPFTLDVTDALKPRGPQEVRHLWCRGVAQGTLDGAHRGDHAFLVGDRQRADHRGDFVL